MNRILFREEFLEETKDIKWVFNNLTNNTCFPSEYTRFIYFQNLDTGVYFSMDVDSKFLITPKSLRNFKIEDYNISFDKLDLDSWKIDYKKTKYPRLLGFGLNFEDDWLLKDYSTGRLEFKNKKTGYEHWIEINYSESNKSTRVNIKGLNELPVDVKGLTHGLSTVIFILKMKFLTLKRLESTAYDIFSKVISEVNKNLTVYEPDWISCQRLFTLEKEVCKSFEEFIEIRFNLEASKQDLFRDGSELTEGHLFILEKLEGVDIVKRRFDKATLRLIDSSDVSEGLTDQLVQELEKIKEGLGGFSVVSFDSFKKKYSIELC